MSSFMIFLALVVFSFLSYSLADPRNLCNEVGDRLRGVYVRDGTTVTCSPFTANKNRVNGATMSSFTFNPPKFTITSGGRPTLPPCPPRAPGNTLSPLGCTKVSTMASFTFNPPNFGITDGGRPTLPACPHRVPENTLSPLGCTEAPIMASFTFDPPSFTSIDIARSSLPPCPSRVPRNTLSPLDYTETNLNQISLPTSVIATISQSYTFPQSMTVPILAPTKASSPSIPGASIFGPILNLPRQETSASVATLLQSFQPISTDNSLHRQPKSTTPALSIIAPISSPTDTGSPAASTASQKSSANMSKRPSVSFLFLCAFLAVLFISPSLATPQAGPSRCVDDSSVLCLGSITVGSFAAPPTAPPSNLPLTSSSALSHVSVHATIVGTGVGSPARCSDNPNYLCIGSLTEGSFAPPPTSAGSSAVSLTGLVSTSTSPITSTNVDDSTSRSSQSPLVSTVQTTTTLGQSTTAAISILTQSQSQHPTASLQSSGTMSMRPPRVFSFLNMIFQLLSSTAATWTTKSLPPMQTFCPENPREGCLNGTPMSELYETKTAPATSPSASQHIMTTSCSENHTSGCVGTPLSQSLTFSTLAPFANTTSSTSGSDSPKHTTVFIYPCSGNATKSCESTISVVPYSHTQMPLSPSPSAPTSVRIVVPINCSEDDNKICIGTATVKPSPCAVDANKLCVGTVVLPTPCSNNTSQMCYSTATASSTVFYQNSSILSTRRGSSSTSNLPVMIGRSTSTVLSTTTLPPSTSMPPAQTSPANTKSAGSLRRKPPQLFFLLWKLFSLWPTLTFAEMLTAPTIPSQTLIALLLTLTATRCTADPIYGCVGVTPATDIAPQSAVVSACAEQTSRFCLGGIVLGTGIQSSFWGGLSQESTSSHTTYSLFVSPTYWSSTTTPSTSSPISTSMSTSTPTSTSTSSEIVRTSTESLPSTSPVRSSPTPEKSGVSKKLASPLILLGMCLFGCLFANHLSRTGSPLPNRPSPAKGEDPNTKEGAKVETDAVSGQLELKVEPPEPYAEVLQSEGVVHEKDIVEKTPREIKREA